MKDDFNLDNFLDTMTDLSINDTFSNLGNMFTDDNSEKPGSKKDLKDLKKILEDFIKDIKITYPEISLSSDLSKLIESDHSDTDKEKALTNVKNHCLEIFPERFFDILYENEEIFSQDSPLYFAH